MQKPWGPNEPNSAHQWWSRWVVTITAGPKRPAPADVRDQFRRYVKQVWRTTIGRVRCDYDGTHYVVRAEVEGPPAHDLGYVEAARQHLHQRFVTSGFGAGARMTLDTALLAGNPQNGQPCEQLVVLPSLRDVLEAQWGPDQKAWPCAETR